MRLIKQDHWFRAQPSLNLVQPLFAASLAPEINDEYELKITAARQGDFLPSAG